MREIKFRALINYSPPADIKPPWWEYYSTFDQPAWLDYAKIIVKDLQFTGCKDKNGVEIFEGDVVAIVGSDCSKCPAKGENEDCDPVGDCPVIEKSRDVVTMERFPLFWLKNEGFGYEGEDLKSPEDCIVIGNVFENPELLNEATYGT